MRILEVSKKVYQRTIGSDFIDTVTKTAANSVYDAFIEQLANSFDADASRVDITLDSVESVIADNGSGMSQEDLNGYFRLGDSPKRMTDKSPGGRDYLGSFGIAAVALRILARTYTMETVKDGVKTMFTETFDKKLDLEKRIEANTTKTESPSGTKITLKELNFKEGKLFSLEELIQKIAWTLPLGTDDIFSVYVNRSLVKPKLVEKSTKFSFDEIGGYMGRVHGTFYLTNSPTKQAGFYIKINGRAIGNPSTVISRKYVPDSIARRIVGILHANEFQKYIKHDRSGFDEGPAYSELTEKVATALRKIQRFSEQKIIVNQRRTALEKRDDYAVQLWREFNSAEIREVTNGMQFGFGDAPDNLPAKILDNRLVFNWNYPSLAHSSKVTLKNSMMLAAVDAIAMHRAGDTIERFASERTCILEMLFKKASQREKREIFPQTYYDLSDLSALAGYSISSLRYLSDNGLLQRYEHGYLGRDMQELLQNAGGLIPLPDFVKKHFSSGVSQTMEKIGTLAEIAGSSIIPFVQNLGSAAKPCYFVERLCEKDIAQIVQGIDFRVNVDNCAQPLIDYASQFFPLVPMAEKLHLTGLEAAHVIDYARRNKVNISNHSEMKQWLHFGHFTYAMQQWRKNGCS